MNVIGRQLFIGTAHGCLVVLDTITLDLLATCQPHSQHSGVDTVAPNISAILPLTFPPPVTATREEDSEVFGEGGGGGVRGVFDFGGGLQ